MKFLNKLGVYNHWRQTFSNLRMRARAVYMRRARAPRQPESEKWWPALECRSCSDGIN